MNKGFTLIELILYVAVVTIMLTALIPTAWNVIGAGSKGTTQQEVGANARFISEKIKYEIRRASGITSASGSTLSLTNFSPDSTTVIDLVGGKIRINRNGGGAVNLNSNDTNVSNLYFTNYTSGDNATRNVQFVFTLNANFSQARQEYQGTITVEGDAELRSN